MCYYWDDSLTIGYFLYTHLICVKVDWNFISGMHH